MVLAENIVASTDYQQYLELMLAKLTDSNPSSRSLGYLIIRALLYRLSGQQQIDAAFRVLQAMNVNKMDAMGDVMSTVGDIQAVCDCDGLISASDLIQ